MSSSPLRPSRLRGFIRRPTPTDVASIAERDHFRLTEHEAREFAEMIDRALSTVDTLDDLQIGHRPAVYTTREAGRRPAAKENPYNAFIRVCHVEGASDGPLSGLRVGVKDNIAVAGVPLTNGSRTASFTPMVDALAVERLLDSGASIVGKMNMDDFALAPTGETSFFGPARNPLDDMRSAGGSSGGTAAGVAAGAIDIGLGVDQGGSGRIPAACCGVVALKATHGLIPTHGITHMDHTIDAVCPTARNVELVARITDAISGPSPRDPQWVRGVATIPPTITSLHQGVNGLRIGIVQEGTDDETDPAVLEGFDSAVDTLMSLGATVERTSIPLWSHAFAIHRTLMFHVFWAMFQSEGIGYGHLGEADEERAHSFSVVRRVEADDFPPALKLRIIVGRYLHETYHSTYHARAQNLRLLLTSQVDTALSEFDLLVTPTAPVRAPLLSETQLSDAELVSRSVEMLANTAPLNLSGHPALAVPIWTLPGELPASLQIIGAHWADGDVLKAGAAVEQARGSNWSDG